MGFPLDPCGDSQSIRAAENRFKTRTLQTYIKRI
jgi:hypothetical protein